MTSNESAGQRRWIIGGMAALALIAMLGVVGLATFPFSIAKNVIARRIGAEFGTHVSIGTIERREIFSFRPTIVIHDLEVSQPLWASPGQMVRARSIEVRISMLALIMGRGAQPDSAVAHGLSIALIRDAKGRASWEGNRQAEKTGSDKSGFGRLLIQDGTISLRDERRALMLAGSLASDDKGFRIDATGRFHEKPVRLAVRGGRIAGRKPDAPYPLRLDFDSSLLRLKASGQTSGALNLQLMALDIHAVAPNLKYLDDVIEAGLFGTGPIDLRAKVRHAGRDWFVDRMTGRIGRSTLVAKADVLKRDGRTKIDADMHFSAFDFDDLSDAQGRAKARAVEARIGPRVLPDTRINIAKVGPTDGVIRFRADRLLLKDSAFRSLAGTIRLDGKLLQVENIVAGMSNGRMTGTVQIDQRGGVAKPRLMMDLYFADGRLETVIGTHDATGPLRGRVAMSGTGDTIRAALANADGHAGMIVRDGSMKRAWAAVLGQDLGKAISTALRDKKAEVPLHCLAIGFAAKVGVLTPSPFVVDTGISSGKGQGTLSLGTERIALTITGRSRDPSGLRLVDPIMVGGTFSAPTLSAVGDPPGSKVSAGSVIKAVGKSIGGILGLSGKRVHKIAAAPVLVDCGAMERQILGKSS